MANCRHCHGFRQGQQEKLIACRLSGADRQLRTGLRTLEINLFQQHRKRFEVVGRSRSLRGGCEDRARVVAEQGGPVLDVTGMSQLASNVELGTQECGRARQVAVTRARREIATLAAIPAARPARRSASAATGSDFACWQRITARRYFARALARLCATTPNPTTHGRRPAPQIDSPIRDGQPTRPIESVSHKLTEWHLSDLGLPVTMMLHRLG